MSLATVRVETRKPRALSSAWIRGAPYRFDLDTKTGALGSTLGSTWRYALPSIIAAAGDAYDPTHEPDGMLGSMGDDKGKFHLHVFVAH